MGLTLEAFGRLTLAEIAIHQEGYKLWRKDREAQQAWMLVNLIQPHVENKLKMLDFMAETKDERAEEIRKLTEAGFIEPDEGVL